MGGGRGRAPSGGGAEEAKRRGITTPERWSDTAPEQRSIVAADWRCPSGEIDILARRGRVLAIIEVKSRRDLARAAESVLPRQRRRIGRAASAFLMTRPDLAALTLRFDVMLVAPQRPPRHLAGAWRSDD